MQSGTRLGAYEILQKIGAGGMGQVYRARDTRLGREVALKLLTEAFSKDEERLARFEREAKVLASLNHPGIATLHGFERTDEEPFLVMELVEGETLSERIARDTLPLGEALPLFVQIAEALEAAHDKGVVHRDLKPANIKITPGGKIKVLDFGLAKALSPEAPSSDLSHSPTAVRDPTAAGVILGTASYMSPEQARGKAVDKRADIWAFGCVLFEALAGRKVFAGETVTDVFAAVLEREPDWRTLPATTPPRIRELLKRCLQKDPRLRFHDVADVRIETEDALSNLSEPAGVSADAMETLKWRPLALSGIAGALLGALALALALGIRSTPEPASPVRLSIVPPYAEPQLRVSSPAISADGKRVAYVAGGRIYLRELNAYDSRPLPGTEQGDRPFFSPDGLWVGFFAGDALKKVSVRSGDPLTLCDAPANSPGASWGPDDVILFSHDWTSGLQKVSASGGEPVVVTTVDAARGEVGHFWPNFLPNGQTVLFTIWTTAGELNRSRIAALDLESGERNDILEGARARYVSSGPNGTSGYLLYFWVGAYQAVGFDHSRLVPAGRPFPILEDTRKESPTGGYPFFDVASNGTLVSIPGRGYLPSVVPVWVSRDGKTETLPFASAVFSSVRISPDGRRAVTSKLEAGRYGLWLLDLEQGTEERLTNEANNFNPRWHPDGKRLAFTSSRGGNFDVLSMALDGSGALEPLVQGQGDEEGGDWSPDGRRFAFTVVSPDSGYDIWLLEPGQNASAKPFVKTPSYDGQPKFSPDGNWIAYQSDVSGRPEVYVQASQGLERRSRVSSQGGTEPTWSPVRREIYYLQGTELLAVSYETGEDGFRPGKPRALFDVAVGAAGFNSYDISPDGERFLFLKDSGEDPPPTELRVETSWIEELKRLAAGTK